MSGEYQEPATELSAAVRDFHRAILSLGEELAAIDWYHQRIQVCSDDELREVLTHNRDEEAEHASMLLEWMRRRTPSLDEPLGRFLFSTGPLTALEAGSGPAGKADLGIGAMKEGE